MTKTKPYTLCTWDSKSNKFELLVVHCTSPIEAVTTVWDEASANTAPSPMETLTIDALFEGSLPNLLEESLELSSKEDIGRIKLRSQSSASVSLALPFYDPLLQEFSMPDETVSVEGGIINANFDEVPDKIVPIKPATYDFSITKADIVPLSNDPNTGQPRPGNKLVVEHEVLTDCPDKGRKITNHLSLQPQYLTGVKRLFMAAGLQPQGTPIQALIGKVVSANIKADTYQDKKQGGKVVETSRISDYNIPGDVPQGNQPAMSPS